MAQSSSERIDVSLLVAVRDNSEFQEKFPARPIV